MPADRDLPIRERAATEARLVAAVGDLIAEKGFGAVGVNAVARRAGTDKVMIYRYFGGLPDLVRAFSETADFWWTADRLMAAPFPDRLSDALGTVFARHAAFLRAHPVTQEVLAWEMSERNALTESLEAVRERRNRELLAAFADRFGMQPDEAETRLGPAFALFGGAANYLAVRARRTPVYSGIDLTSDVGWTVLAATVATLARTLSDTETREDT